MGLAYLYIIAVAHFIRYGFSFIVVPVSCDKIFHIVPLKIVTSQKNYDVAVSLILTSYNYYFDGVFQFIFLGLFRECNSTVMATGAVVDQCRTVEEIIATGYGGWLV